MTAPRRPLAALVAAGALLAAVWSPVPAGAQASPLDAATAEVTSAQQAADAAAARYEEAVGRVEELAARIAALEAGIATGKTQVRELRLLARQRAVRAYTGRDILGDGSFILDGSDPLDAVRREKLLAETKAREDAAAAELADAVRDLATQRRELESVREREETALRAAEVEQAAVQTKLQSAQQALSALEEQLRQQEEARKAAEIAASIARSASSRSNGKDYSGTAVVGGIVCPIRGAVSFIDSWGASRHQGAHQGVDLMAARGTPNVAVVPGNVTFKAGGTSGNGAYLRGDDGNLYYYFHLEAYEGGARHVSQGEVIGYVGNTGDARYTATHTHFEIHPGGGGAVNPYPSVRAVC